MTKRCKNAITHGVYAEEVVLPWEDAQAFDKLHQDVRRDLKPSGYLQEQKVFDVAKELWRKQRLAIGYVLPFYKKQITPELMEAAKGGIAGLAVYLADQSNRGPDKFAEIVKAHNAMIAKLNNVNKPVEPPKKTNGITAEIVERTYDLDALEKLLKIEATLDSRIKNHMAGFFALKAHQQMYAEKPIEFLPPPEASPVDPPNPSPPEWDKVMTRSNGSANNLKKADQE